jgi:type VI protein secretion system component Hcp
LSDFSLTRHADELSPLFSVALLRNEIYPFFLVRSFSEENGVLSIMDYELRNASYGRCHIFTTNIKSLIIYCRIGSVSIGAGGGSPIETVSIAYEAIIMRYISVHIDKKEVLKSTRSFWDSATSTGSRDGPSNVPTLSQMCRSYAKKNNAALKIAVRITRTSSVSFWTRLT